MGTMLRCSDFWDQKRGGVGGLQALVMIGQWTKSHISRIIVHPNHPRDLCSAGLYPFPLDVLVSEVGNITEDEIAARIQKGLHYVTGLITVKPGKP